VEEDSFGVLAFCEDSLIPPPAPPVYKPDVWRVPKTVYEEVWELEP
jgi:hypothetical protein